MVGKIIRTFSFLSRHTGLIVLFVLLSIVAALLEGVAVALVFPLLQGIGGSAATQAPALFGQWLAFFMKMSLVSRLQMVAIFLLVAVVTKNIFLYSADLINARIQNIVIRHFRERCSEQLMKVGMGYFNRQRHSDLQIIIDGYTEYVAGAVVGLIGTAVTQMFTASILLCFLFALSWKLTLIAIGFVSLASVFVHIVSRNILVASKIVYDARMEFNHNLLDIILGMKLIRLFNREKAANEKFLNNVGMFCRARFRSDVYFKMVSPVFEVVGITMLGGVLFVGSFFIYAHGDIWLGVILNFVVIMSRMIAPIKILNYARATVLEKWPIMKSITKFLSLRDKEYLLNGMKHCEGIKEEIRWEHVTFSYPGTEMEALKDVSFSVRRGHKIGVVGPSGAGKSTVIELLLRFYDPVQGQIRIDGQNLKDLDIGSWRRRIGVVAQDTFLFNDTIFNNIAFARSDASRTDVENAAKRAAAHDFISLLPRQYDTIIGERGILLSGGQKQRIAIARAILTDPDIYVLDEATSALDTESERFVHEALNIIGREKTVITIAHRLSTVFNSDMILVLDRGYLIEQGSHQQLIRQNGVYAKLVQLQDLETVILKKEKDLGVIV